MKAPIVIATRAGFFSRLQLRSPIFSALQQSDHPLVILWQNADQHRDHLNAQLGEQVIIEEFPQLPPPRSTRQLLELWFQTVRLYAWKKDQPSALPRQRLAQLVARQRQNSRLTDKLVWWLQAAAISLSSRSRTVRSLLLRLEQQVTQGDQYRALLEKLKPSVIFTASPGYAVWHDDAYLIETAQAAGIPTVCVILSWDNTSSKGLSRVMPDYFLVWTEEMKAELINFHDVPADRITIVGTPIFDAYHQQIKVDHRALLQQRYGLDPTRKTLLIGTKSPVYPYNAEFVRRLLELADAGRFSQPVQIIVRPHPLNLIKGRENKELERLAELTKTQPHVYLSQPQTLTPGLMDLPWEEVEEMVTLINGSDLVINFFSTMQLEAALADKPILNLAYDYAPVGTQKSLTEEEEQYHNARLIRAGGVVSAYSEQELIDKINRYLEHPELEREGRRRIAQQECQPFDGKSAERIAQFILNIANKSNIT